MGLVDKNQIEDIKKVLTDKSEAAVKEAQARRKVDTMSLSFEIGKEIFKNGGFTKEEYLEYLHTLNSEVGINSKMFKK